jgi:hypothetical protein
MHLTTYYTIIGVALSSIPVISGYLILKTSSSIASMFAGSADGYAEAASAGVGNYFSQAAAIDGLNRYAGDLYKDQQRAVEQLNKPNNRNFMGDINTQGPQSRVNGGGGGAGNVGGVGGNNSSNLSNLASSSLSNDLKNKNTA